MLHILYLRRQKDGKEIVPEQNLFYNKRGFSERGG
jgi:hypothetical protein